MIYGIGEKLQFLRKSRKLSQEEVARRIGITNSTLSSYETSARIPGLETLMKLALFYNVKLDYLVGVDKRDYISLDGLDTKEKELVKQMCDIFRDKNNCSDLL